MRITLLSYDDEPPLGGQGVEVRGMRAALRERGHMVATVSGHGDHRIAYGRVTGRAPLDFSIHVNRHPQVVRATTPDVVHAFGGPGGVLLLRDVGAPVVYTANHTYRMAHGRGSLKRLLSPLEGIAYRGAAAVLAISPSTAEAVRKLGVAAARIEVLGPGVDVPDEPPAPREAARLLFAGRWEAHKGVVVAVAVMGAVTAARPGTTGIVLGGGTLDGAVRRAAERVAGIEVAGRVEEARLAGEYARASIVLMPSLYEGLGLVALEAQASGAVVAGYDVVGLRDAVAHRDLLVPAGDDAALVRMCIDLIDDSQRRDELARAAQEWVRRTHSWSRAGERLEQVYDAVRSR